MTLILINVYIRVIETLAKQTKTDTEPQNDKTTENTTGNKKQKKGNKRKKKIEKKNYENALSSFMSIYFFQTRIF